MSELSWREGKSSQTDDEDKTLKAEETACAEVPGQEGGLKTLSWALGRI